MHEAESEHCESEFEFEFCDRYDNPESTPLSICGVFESFFPLESDFIEPPPSLTTFEFITLNENITMLISVSVTLSEVVSEAWSLRARTWTRTAVRTRVLSRRSLVGIG